MSGLLLKTELKNKTKIIPANLYVFLILKPIFLLIFIFSQKTKEFFKIFTEFQYVVKAAVEVNEDGEEVPADKSEFLSSTYDT